MPFSRTPARGVRARAHLCQEMWNVEKASLPALALLGQRCCGSPNGSANVTASASPSAIGQVKTAHAQITKCGQRQDRSCELLNVSRLGAASAAPQRPSCRNFENEWGVGVRHTRNLLGPPQHTFSKPQAQIETSLETLVSCVAQNVNEGLSSLGSIRDDACRLPSAEFSSSFSPP